MLPASFHEAEGKAANQGNGKNTLNDGSEAYIHSIANTQSGREEGNNSRPGHENEPRDLSTTGANPLGTGEQSVDSHSDLPDIDEDAQMDLNEILMRHRQAKRSRAKSTLDGYGRVFTKFWELKELEGKTKAQLSQQWMRQAIIDFVLDEVKPASQHRTVMALKSVLTRGAGVPWLVHEDEDFGRFAKPVKRQPPPEDTVRKWAEIVHQVKDPVRRVLLYFTIDYGWRPTHSTGVRWSNIKEDEDGKMLALVNDGREGLFKYDEPIQVALNDREVEALQELRKQTHAGHNDFIIPNVGLLGKPNKGRNGKGAVSPTMGTPMVDKFFMDIEQLYDLPHLTPVDFRHYAISVCIDEHDERNGLKTISRHRMQGHEYKELGDAMAGTYNDKDWELVIDNQKMVFPDGILGRLLGPKVPCHEDAIPAGIAQAWEDYKAGKLKPSTLPDIFNDALRTEMRKKAAVTPTTMPGITLEA